MGCDGGTIPKRHEVVRHAKYKPVENERAKQHERYTECALSAEVLSAPLSADALGHLFNKQALLEAIVEGSVPAHLSHIRSFKKDVYDLNVTPNTDFVEGTDNVMSKAKFVCPLTGVEMNGMLPFVFFPDCGCVFSEKAIKEVPSATCLRCGAEVDAADAIPFNPTAEKEEELRGQLAARRTAKKKADKLRKKNKKRRGASATDATAPIAAIAATADAGLPVATATAAVAVAATDDDGPVATSTADAEGSGDGSSEETNAAAAAAAAAAADVPSVDEKAVKRLVKRRKNKQSGRPSKRPKVVLATGVDLSKVEAMPATANPDVWKSMFTSGNKDNQVEETFCCRSTSGYGWGSGHA